MIFAVVPAPVQPNPAQSPGMYCIIVLSLCHQDQNCHIKCNEDGLTQSGSLHHRQIVMSCLTISTLLLWRRGSTAGRILHSALLCKYLIQNIIYFPLINQRAMHR